jgi:hypothetical protein
MSITLRGGVWHCHFVTPSGKRIRRSLGTGDKKQAQELHDKLKAEAWRVDKIGELPTRTFEECCIRWIARKSISGPWMMTRPKSNTPAAFLRPGYFDHHGGGGSRSRFEDGQPQAPAGVGVAPGRSYTPGKGAARTLKKPVSQATKSQHLSFMRSCSGLRLMTGAG